MPSLDAQFDEAKIATGQVRKIGDFAETEWAKSWGATRQVPDREGGEITIPAPPWHFSADTTEDLPIQVPAIQGEHNREVLLELGYDSHDIDRLYTLSALVGGPENLRPAFD